jgi:hypothetical protein
MYLTIREYILYHREISTFRALGNIGFPIGESLPFEQWGNVYITMGKCLSTFRVLGRHLLYGREQSIFYDRKHPYFSLWDSFTSGDAGETNYLPERDGVHLTKCNKIGASDLYAASLTSGQGK